MEWAAGELEGVSAELLSGLMEGKRREMSRARGREGGRELLLLLLLTLCHDPWTPLWAAGPS